jgi:hypothetical protein
MATESPEEIAAEISSIRREVDTLKAVVNRPERPWYLDGSLILAAIAFIFSVYTYRRQDLNDTQVHLDNVLKELYALPERELDVTQKYKGKAVDAQLIIQFGHQYDGLSLQAYQLAQHLGSHLDPPERMAVAQAIAGYEPQLAEKMLTNPPIPADDVEDLVAARQGLGTIQIMSGRAQLGDQNFQAALDIVKSPDLHFSALVQTRANALTEISWEEAYLNISDCRSAEPHLNAAQQEVQQLAGTTAGETLLPQLTADLAAEARCSGVPASQ